MVRHAAALALAIVAPFALAAGSDAGEEAKVISGMSIVGNNEAPKSLFIVPWKSSEIGFETGLTSGILDDAMRPVDREVFMREIEFYEISTAD
jgi:hypothetical protein